MHQPLGTCGVRHAGHAEGGVDHGGAPLVIDAPEQAKVLGTGADKIAVILNRDDDAEFFAVIGTFPEGLGEVGLHGVTRSIIGS
mgnify:CR=1 FL=1